MTVRALPDPALVADGAGCSLMRNTIRMNSAAMRENTTPTTTPAIEDNSRMNPPNGLIAIAASPEEDAGDAEQHDQADHQPVERLDESWA